MFLVGGLGDSTIAWTSRWMVKRFDERLVKWLDVCTNHRAITRTNGVFFLFSFQCVFLYHYDMLYCSRSELSGQTFRLVGSFCRGMM